MFVTCVRTRRRSFATAWSIAKLKPPLCSAENKLPIGVKIPFSTKYGEWVIYAEQVTFIVSLKPLCYWFTCKNRILSISKGGQAKANGEANAPPERNPGQEEKSCFTPFIQNKILYVSVKILFCINGVKHFFPVPLVPLNGFHRALRSYAWWVKPSLVPRLSPTENWAGPGSEAWWSLLVIVVSEKPSE